MIHTHYIPIDIHTIHACKPKALHCSIFTSVRPLQLGYYKPTFLWSSLVKSEPAPQRAQIWSVWYVCCKHLDQTTIWSLQMKTFGYFFNVSGLFASSVPFPFKLFLVQCMIKTLTPKHHSRWQSTVSFLPTMVKRFCSLWNEFLGPRRPHGVEADQGAIFVENDQWCFLLALLVSCAAESLVCAWDVVTWWFGTVGHPLIACPSCKSRMCCKLVWPYEAASMREPGYIISLLLHVQFAP